MPIMSERTPAGRKSCCDKRRAHVSPTNAGTLGVMDADVSSDDGDAAKTLRVGTLRRADSIVVVGSVSSMSWTIVSASSDAEPYAMRIRIRSTSTRYTRITSTATSVCANGETGRAVSAAGAASLLCKSTWNAVTRSLKSTLDGYVRSNAEVAGTTSQANVTATNFLSMLRSRAPSSGAPSLGSLYDMATWWICTRHARPHTPVCHRTESFMDRSVSDGCSGIVSSRNTASRRWITASTFSGPRRGFSMSSS